MKRLLQLLGAAFTLGLLIALWLLANTHHANAQDQPAATAATDAICVLTPTAGNATSGVIRFHEEGGFVTIEGEITDLAPDTIHAWHIHEFGDISDPEGKAAGGHYNPEGYPHALPDTDMRHAGDLGNIEADDNGFARARIVVDNITIDGAHNPVVGRAVIIHALPDDGGQPTGNAGGRVAQGVIGIAAPGE